MMWVWLLKRVIGARDPIHDCTDGFVIIAADERSARAFAQAEAGDEGAEVWRDAARSTAMVIGVATSDRQAGAILQDFNAG